VLWRPPVTAANQKKVLKCSQSQSDVKYKSTGFEYFEKHLGMEAKKKVEYYKIHKSIYDYKKERERELQNELVLLEKIMPIYSKEDIIQIKNGNMQPVLQFNSLTRPNSASHRVLMRDTDPLNNLKRRFYRNSNKPLG
jgi:hypothetical protein